MKYYLSAFKKYAVFTGRASRKEFWMFVLFNIIALCICIIMDEYVLHTTFKQGTYISSIAPGYISLGYTLAMFAPTLALSVRRLHDIGKNGLILATVVNVGALIVPTANDLGLKNMQGNVLSVIYFTTSVVCLYMLFLCTKPSEPGSNQYGEHPEM